MTCDEQPMSWTGEAVADLRAGCGLSQAQLADLLAIDRKTIVRWEGAPEKAIPQKRGSWLDVLREAVAAAGPDALEQLLHQDRPVPETWFELVALTRAPPPPPTPRLFTPERAAAIVEALKNGAYAAQAAEAAGVARSTYYDWLAKGRAAASGPLHDFANQVDRAEAAVENSAVAALRRAWEDGDWRSAEAYLKRKHVDRWGTSLRVETSEPAQAASGERPDSLADLGLNDAQIRVLGRQLARLESGQVPVPALTLKGEDEDDDSWQDGEEGVDWEWGYADDGEEE